MGAPGTRAPNGSAAARACSIAQQFSLVEGVKGAVSASVADKCNRVLGQEFSPEEEK